MRLLILVLLAAAPALHAQQLGMPMSAMPGVEAGMGTVVGNTGAGGIEGISLPAGALNRLLMAPTGTRPGGDVGREIERSFFGGDAAASAGAAGVGLQGAAARAVTGAPPPQPSPRGGVQASGTAIQLPTSQQLMPSNMIPGYQSTRGLGTASPTGVENVFTGSGIPRPGGAP
jgi:hypothetical protein